MTEVVVFVEVPSGSRNKYEFDPASGTIMLDRRLFQVYKDLEQGKSTETRGFGDRAEAERLIAGARQRASSRALSEDA